MCKFDGSWIGTVTGLTSLALVIYDLAKKGAKIRAVLDFAELDGQTQKEKHSGDEQFKDVHWCIFKFGIRLENSGNEICTLTNIQIESAYKHEPPVLDFDTDERYLKIQPGTSGFFQCENRVAHVGDQPKNTIRLSVRLNFIGHKSIKMPIEFTVPTGMYRSQ